MKIRHLILMLLDACGGKINSKTKLQKEIYFLALLLSRDLGFKAHYYGPYSVEVENALDELIGAGFVDIKRDIWGIDTRYGFENKRYDFSLTESGRKFVRILAEESSDEYKVVKTFVEKLKEMGDPDYFSLSIAAKAYFILDKEGKLLTKEQIREKAREFGWKVGENDIDIAINILKNLDFVKEQ